MKRLIPIVLALSIFLSSCGGATGDLTAPLAEEETTPTMSVEEIRATADVLVYEMLTQTAIAMPTNTPLPPTATPLPPTVTLAPTATPESIQAEPTAARIRATPTEATAPTTAVLPTNTAVSPAETYSCTEKPLTAWDVPSTTITVKNTLADTTGSVFLCIVTSDGQAGYISIPFGGSAQVPYGTVTATGWATGAKSFNDTIFFEVKTTEPKQIFIENGRIYLRGGCYPNC